jgi:hypothetical protein
MAPQIWALCEQDLSKVATARLWRIIVSAGAERPDIMKRAEETARRRGQETAMFKQLSWAVLPTEESVGVIEAAAEGVNDPEAKAAAQDFIAREREQLEAGEVGGYIVMLAKGARLIRDTLDKGGPSSQEERASILKQLTALEDAIKQRLAECSTARESQLPGHDELMRMKGLTAEQREAREKVQAEVGKALQEMAEPRRKAQEAKLQELLAECAALRKRLTATSDHADSPK